MNRIACKVEYTARFEELFSSRAREVDKSPGFHWVKVLRPVSPDQPYIVMSMWDKQEDFDAWRKTEAFKMGHMRGFEDIAEARKRGEEPPMTSDMVLYDVFAD